MADTADLVKIHVDLPEHWGTGGEAMCAKPVGPDLYEIDNIPFYAYGINLGDVVRAIARDEQTKPEILEVVETRGHRTLRFFFSNEVTESEQSKFLAVLKVHGAAIERATDRYIALDVPPEVDYGRVCDVLGEAEASNLLQYETCEMRVAGRFDLDAPRDSDA